MDANERLDRIEKSIMDMKTTLNSILLAIQKVAIANSQIVKPVNPPQPFKTVVPPKPPVIIEAPKPVAPVVIPPVVETPKPVVEAPKPSFISNPAAMPPIELINLLNSKEWPHAVDPTLICDISSDQDKEDRAEGILDLIIDVHLENLKFLDFGCGEGNVINRSRTQKPKMSVGYDIQKNERWDKWEKAPNVLFTDKWEEVKNLGPFNVVLMYDVIDHMLEADLVNQLKEVKNILAMNGKIFMRTHPWCSRHGSHLYRQLNKAFAHMVFTDDELKAMGYNQELVRKILTPVLEYGNLFTAAGLKINSGPHSIKEGVEPFFTNNHMIADRIKNNYKQSIRPELRAGQFPSGPMEIQFVDYILT